MADERIIEAENMPGEDPSSDRAIRPRTLAEYVGQTRVREQMEIFISAAK